MTESASSTTSVRRRQARTAPRTNPGRCRITGRDRSVLRALARTRYLSTSLIALYIFHGSRRVANRRMRTLLDLGFVRVFLTSLHEDNVYGLSAAGRRLLEESDDDLPAVIQCPRLLDEQWQHALAINAVRVHLAVDLGRIGGRITSWRSNRELRSGARRSVVPDALFSVDWSEDGEQTYVLEVEFQTRAPQAFLRKVARYTVAAFRTGGILGERQPMILVVGQNPVWLHRYRRATAHLALPLPIAFATLADLEHHGPTAAIWQMLGDDENLCLRNLESCGYRNYGLNLENRAQSRLCAADAAQIPECTPTV